MDGEFIIAQAAELDKGLGSAGMEKLLLYAGPVMNTMAAMTEKAVGALDHGANARRKAIGDCIREAIVNHSADGIFGLLKK